MSNNVFLFQMKHYKELRNKITKMIYNKISTFIQRYLHKFINFKYDTLIKNPFFLHQFKFLLKLLIFI